ncbi:anion-transporting ATPase-like domain-containing protein [Tribonema minus]|uniref:Anion-transporting ATPase-like domain-containing protein n=1 Tax=Tribonema minus TaxID=303371 RepID=A0A835Z1W4_9STRA|nr:anion-transporting ATPase-like domain-containing protein [Tribonema minus]
MRRLATMSDGGDAPIKVTKVPFFDMEVTGVYPLRYMAGVAFGGDNAANWDDLINATEQRFVIVGGKGGVGKTSSSAALAVKFADAGHDTVVVSTDPAHSLGDALQMDLQGALKGTLAAVPGGAAGGGGGRLYALEVDTEGAISEFKEVVSSFLKRSKAQAEDKGGSSGGLLDKLNLEDFAGVLDNAPPGTDELVALSKVLKLVRGENAEGIKFDRVVIDTAPTGHTLRMLSYPEFLDEFFEKIIKIRGRFKGASALMGVLGGLGKGTGASSSSGDAAAEEEDRDRLRDFQFKMMELQELFRDQERSEFVVVTIPSMLAVAESERLVRQLREQEVPVEHMVINKVITAETSEGYVQRLTKGQAKGVRQLEALARDSGIALTRVPMFDAEVRGVYGLRAMASVLFR